MNWRIRLATRPAVLFGAMFIAALLALLPMRLALGWFGLGERGVTAREVAGSIWWGGLGEARFGDVALGDVSAGLSPIQLFVGRARIDLQGLADSPGERLRGALGISRTSSGIDDVTAHLVTGNVFAPLPVTALDLADVSVRFEDGQCLRADGRVTATIAAVIPQLNLPQTMTGIVRCEGGQLLVPLASAAQTESVALTLSESGRFRAVLTARPADAAAIAGLVAVGFQPSAQGYRLSIEGAF